MPEDCGSTKFKIICADIAASIAVPPASNIRFADIVALGSAVTAIYDFAILYFALPILLIFPSGEDL